MRILLIVLAVVFLAFAIVGFLVKALLWLAVLGLILFAATVAYWVIRAKLSHRDDEPAQA